MDPKKLQELRDKRKQLLDQADAILKQITDGTGAFTAEQRAAYDKALAEMKGLDETIVAADAIGERRAALAKPVNPPASQPGPEQLPTDPSIGMGKKDLRKYSLVRLIRSMSEPNASERFKEAAFELECSRAVAKHLGKEARGAFIPFDVMVANPEFRASDMLKGTATAGGDLIATELLAANFIELLRNKMVVRAAGAKVLTGLIGNIAIPSQTAASGFYWVAEDGSPTETGAAVGQVTMSPHTGGSVTQISRKLLLQSSVDVEALMRDDLAAVVALGIDLACLHGSGGSNQPYGVISTTGVTQVVIGTTTTTGGVPTWANVLAFETAVAIANADIGNLAYITNPKVRGLLKATPKVGTTFPIFMWEGGNQPGQVNGYDAYATNQVSSTLTKTQTGLSAMFFGNWADLIVGLWGGLDILVDPYSQSTIGAVRVVALQDLDIGVRHVGSFSYASDIAA
ncbi:MAG: phage major capsid protein [Thermoanaerobaculaceae bacterium]|jgi:HK97 family phage major capsid protein